MVATAIGECGIRRDNVYAYALVQWFGNGAGKMQRIQGQTKEIREPRSKENRRRCGGKVTGVAVKFPTHETIVLEEPQGASILCFCCPAVLPATWQNKVVTSLNPVCRSQEMSHQHSQKPALTKQIQCAHMRNDKSRAIQVSSI